MAYYNEGKYMFRVENHGFKFVMKDGNEVGIFFLEGRPVEEQLPDGSYQPIDGQHARTVDIWLDDESFDKSYEFVKSLGWDGAAWKDLNPGGSVSLVNQCFPSYCKHKADKDGKLWDRFYPAMAVNFQPKESDEKVARKLDNMFGKKMRKAVAAAKVGSEPVDVAAEGQGENNDDLPF